MKTTLIRDRRLAAGLTQSEVAMLTGISLPHYQKLEYGNCLVGSLALKRAIKLSRLLNISMIELENADDFIEDTE